MCEGNPQLLWTLTPAASSINNDDRPDEAFTTERAQRAGRANAASGWFCSSDTTRAQHQHCRKLALSLSSHRPTGRAVLARCRRPRAWVPVVLPRYAGRIMVNIPNDHFGPIPAEADPRGTVSSGAAG